MKEKLLRIFDICFMLVFGLLVLYNVQKSFPKSKASIAAVLAVWVLLYGYKRGKKRIPNKAPWRAMSVCVLLLSMFWTLACGFALRTGCSSYTWDWVRIVTDCAGHVTEGADFPAFYFAQYKNNQFICVCLTLLFRLVRVVKPSVSVDGLITASVVCSCGAVMLSILFLYACARVLWGERKAFFTSLVLLGYMPLYLYATFAYTDTFGLPFVCFALLCLSLLTKGRGRWFLWVLAGAAFGIGGGLKVTVWIFLTAVCIMLVLTDETGWRRLCGRLACLLGAAAAMTMLVSAACGRLFAYTEQTYDRYEFPPVQWVMMSMNPDASGGYVGEDVVFAESFETYREREEQCRARLMQRLHDMGLGGTIKTILYVKQRRTWCEPALAGDDYIARDSLNEDGLLRNLFGKKGKQHKLFLRYMWAVHMLILSFCAVSAWNGGRSRTQLILAMRIALFGIFLFLSVWECNSRYLYIFVPALLLAAADGCFWLGGTPNK